MTLDRAIQLLQVEKEYALKQRGFQQKPINKEVAEAIGIAIEAVKSKVDIVRCKNCNHYISGFCTRDINGRTNMFRMGEDDFCSYSERKTDNA